MVCSNAGDFDGTGNVYDSMCNLPNCNADAIMSRCNANDLNGMMPYSNNNAHDFGCTGNVDDSEYNLQKYNANDLMSKYNAHDLTGMS